MTSRFRLSCIAPRRDPNAPRRPNAPRLWALCLLVGLPLSKPTHAQDPGALPPPAEQQDSASDPSDASQSAHETDTPQDTAVSSPDPNHAVSKDSAQEEVPPTHLPHIFFDNRLNPIDYLGQQLELDEAQEATIRSGKSDLLLRETTDGEHTLRRRYALVSHRHTTISHRNRRHELDDEVRQTLDIQMSFSHATPTKERLRVVVRHADPSYPDPAAPLQVRVPSSGLALDCLQRDFEIQCVRADTGAPIAWPQWATLDMSDWFSRRPLASGDRWRRTFADPRVVGWSDGASGRMHSALQITESGPASGEDTTHIQGTLDGKGELKVYHRMESMPVEGQVDIEFDHGAGMVRHLVWQWDGSLSSEGLLAGHRYQWTRTAATILRVNTTRTDD